MNQTIFERYGGFATVRKIVSELEAMPRERARFVAAFAYILGRVAHADQQISAEETAAMEEIVCRFGDLPEEQAVLVVQIAKGQNRLFGGTENFLVTREFRDISSPDERRHLLDCMFAVSAADDSISTVEESQIRQIASELGFTHRQFVDAAIPKPGSFGVRSKPDRFRCAGSHHRTRHRCHELTVHVNPQVVAVGVNCTAPRLMSSLIAEVRRGAPTQSIVAYPNSGEVYDGVSRSWVPAREPADDAGNALALFSAGARLIGGCCRTTARPLG